MKVKNALLLIVTALALTLSAAPKNIILFIGDGMSTPQRMTANEFSIKAGRGNLVMNAMPVQATTRTCSATSLVTDSAAAATAIACGKKTSNGAVGVGPSGERLESVAEVAHKAGRKVGIVTSVTINHATPAGFYGHRKSRGEGYALGLDLIASGFDYFAGGALTGHNKTNDVNYSGDIYDKARDAGYTFLIKDRKAFENFRPSDGKLWYVAGDNALPFAIDSTDWGDIPTLAELTAKGLELLENDRGFFMMVEGGKIDWAGHGNDAATNLREVLALDDAVKVALDYQATHPDTLVLVTGDHETGGMTMGFAGTGYAFYMERLANQKRSADFISSYIKKNHPKTLEDLQPILSEKFGFDFTTTDTKQNPMAVTDKERKALSKALLHDLELIRQKKAENAAYDAKKKYEFPTAIKHLMSHKAGIDWTSSSHTALPVLTTAIGPESEMFGGLMDNTDIANRIKTLLQP